MSFFVTGTDTGVGKTLVSCALLHFFRSRGKRAVGMKPVAAGATLSAEGPVNQDVSMLRAASSVSAPAALTNPYCFLQPVAPHIAARHEGTHIDVARIAGAFVRLQAMADIVIVEGAGGFCVPLNMAEDSTDLARRLGLPVILVVGIRLGCLNHALLTAQAIRSCGLEFAGWVANRIDASMQVADENVSELRARLPAPLLGDIGFAEVPDPRSAATCMDPSTLA